MGMISFLFFNEIIPVYPIFSFCQDLTSGNLAKQKTVSAMLRRIGFHFLLNIDIEHKNRYNYSISESGRF